MQFMGKFRLRTREQRLSVPPTKLAFR
jgi:hypothetical protein